MTISQIHDIFLQCAGKITTDSRQISGGEIFWAVKGENFDGNSFAIKALETGCSYAVVSDESQVAKDSANGPFKDRVIPVHDTLKTLQQLATFHRENTLNDGRRIRIIALTGTNGKTTTKELIRAVLSTGYTVTATQGNLNNDLGVPLSLLSLTPETMIAVIETGASHPGDIRTLVDIVHPDFGIITNVGRAHLLGFVDFDGVKRTKGEMYDYIRSVRGKCFVNVSSPDLVGMVRERDGLLTIPYGRDIQKAKILEQDADNPFLRMEINDEGQEYRIETDLVGAYNMDNVLCALAVGKEFGVDTETAIKAIEAYRPTNSRSQIVRTASNILVVDAYNANPSSMEASLENFRSIQAGHKAVCLGDMLELGNESIEEHLKILDKLCNMHLELVALAGREFARAARESIYPEVKEFKYFESSQELANYLQNNTLSNFTVLIKGSRGTRMENIIPML